LINRLIDYKVGEGAAGVKGWIRRNDRLSGKVREADTKTSISAAKNLSVFYG
jgi:hypothetical protein